MIQELSIRNFALIDEIQFELSPGLNILTGETGAGKSIIIGAVSLILGERGSADVVRAGANSAIIEAVVDITDNRAVIQSVIQKDADLYSADDDGMLLLSRQISANGRSRCHINGRLATISLLKDIGDLLVDIHGQHEHQSLFRPEKHLELLDSFGGLVSLCEQVTNQYNQILDLHRQLVNLERELKERLREQELLEYQLNELTEAKLKEGEDEQLQSEKKILSNAEMLFELANIIIDQLYGDSASENIAVIDKIKTLTADMSKLCQIDNALTDVDDRLKSTLYELEDIARQIREYRDTIEFNPIRLEEVEERLDLIYRLKRKYGNTISEILAYQSQVAQALDELNFSATRITELKGRIDTAMEDARQLAVELSQRRQKSAQKLETLIERELHTLGMDKTAFKVLVVPKEAPQDMKKQFAFPTIEREGKRYELGHDGIDDIEFLISPNVGEELKPLTKIASGGEISRVMLALKTILAEIDEMPTMIFDEIDAGIGGRTAHIIGQKLKQIAKVRQVLCITHLPQIACVADAHVLVEKNVYGDHTRIEARRLNTEERVHEIARMLGGQNTEITLAHAQEMLERGLAEGKGARGRSGKRARGQEG